MSNDDLLSNADLDKVEEYFKMKDAIRVLRNDLKDLKVQKAENQELEKLLKKVKELREDVKDDENIKTLAEKIMTMKERMDLLKELIRIELLDKAQEEVKRNGRKLRIVSILREMKDQENAKKSPFKKRLIRNYPNCSNMGFENCNL